MSESTKKSKDDIEKIYYTVTTDISSDGEIQDMLVNVYDAKNMERIYHFNTTPMSDNEGIIHAYLIFDMGLDYKAYKLEQL